MKLNFYLVPYTKIKPKWIKSLNIRPETLKLLVENIEKISLTLVLVMTFEYKIKAQRTKAKRNKWQYIKPKSFSIANETGNKMK